MARLTLKSSIVIIVLMLGVAVLWAGCAKQSASSPQFVPVSQLATERSGKVLIHFKQFEFGKDWAADFEITNDTTQPVAYVGSNDRERFTYCTLGVKHQEQYENLSFKVRDPCIYGTNLSLQTLEPGQSAVLAVNEYEVRDLLHPNDAKLPLTAQIGFEVFVGNERRREILWSEEITFPTPEHP